ncbi:hypothetical protein Trisim1_001603 [Trichoderma cf. simile WF8]
MQIRSPQHLITNIDIVDRNTSFGHSKDHIRGALVSIDLNCPAHLFFSGKNVVVQFSLSFTTEIQYGFHKTMAIQHAEVGYFRADNNILLNQPNPDALKIKTETFIYGKADIELLQPNAYERNDFSNIRVLALLDAYPSHMEVFASIAHLSTTDGNDRPSHASTTRETTHETTRKVPSPDEKRLRRLLCWTAALGYENFFDAYLEHGPTILYMEDEFGMTAFSYAASAGQTSIIRRVLQQKDGCTNAREKITQGPSPLEAAALRNDAQVFVSFLRLLKYFALEDEIELDKIPPLEKLPTLEEKDIEDEIRRAVENSQTAIIEKLIQMRLKNKLNKEEWLLDQMVKAAETGALSLVQVLKSCGAKINSEVDVVVNGEVDHKTTPLMSAINNNRANVAEFLIIHGAGNEDALRIAVKNKQHSIIRALLQAGILVKGDLKTELLNLATEQKDSTTLMLLVLEKGTGKLATLADLDPVVDAHFEATIVTFQEEKIPEFEELSVAKLMKKSNGALSLNNKGNKFQWVHLPANNMKWVEVLFGKIYHEDPSLAYKVLEPKRWVKRQHEGDRGSPHARFMMPACHDFSEAFKDKRSERFRTLKKDRHVFLFMPYLHWDEEDTMQKRSKYLAGGSSGEKISYNRVGNETSRPPERLEKEKMLLNKYLVSEGDCDLNFRHVLHIRRTLDQYLYHNLKDTIIRDADQTVHRYQKKLNNTKIPENEDPFTAIMVDQLWLWILVDQSGKAKAIVTCFPSRDWSDVGVSLSWLTRTKSILDRRRTTDVLQSTRSYIQQRPDVVKTPYDLAGIIAKRCSKALFGHSTEMLNFADVYENSISDIMNEETMLFNEFNSLMQTRIKIMDGFTKMLNAIDNSSNYIYDRDSENTILDHIQWLLKQDQTPEDPERLCNKYRKFTLESEIPDMVEIMHLSTIKDERKKKEYFNKLLEKFGRFYVLDITREISLLSQIKDIQDELGIMKRVFTEQRKVLEAMNRIIRVMEQHNSDLKDTSNLDNNLDSNDNKQSANLDTKLHYREASGSGRTKDYKETKDRLGAYDDSRIDTSPMTTYALASGLELQKHEYRSQSTIWGLGHQEHNLPLRTVLRYCEQIEKMLERAKIANDSLSSLVDLKQKQSNIIDTRTARLQAEQSHTMTLQAEKQGKTLMILSIVTIVFLPLSFLAAFFAIPTKEFEDDKLTLGFVSEITCEL